MCHVFVTCVTTWQTCAVMNSSCVNSMLEQPSWTHDACAVMNSSSAACTATLTLIHRRCRIRVRVMNSCYLVRTNSWPCYVVRMNSCYLVKNEFMTLTLIIEWVHDPDRYRLCLTTCYLVPSCRIRVRVMNSWIHAMLWIHEFMNSCYVVPSWNNPSTMQDSGQGHEFMLSC